MTSAIRTALTAEQASFKTPFGKGSYRYHVAFVFLFALVVRCVYLWVVFDESLLKWLPYNLDQIALRHLGGEPHRYPTAWGSYPVVLGFFYSLLDIVGWLELRHVATVAVNALLGALAASLVYQLAKLVVPGRPRLALALALIFALYYPALYFNALVLSENLFLPVVLAITYVCLSRRVDSRRGSVVLGLLTGTAVVIRPIFAPFLPLLLFWIWLACRWRLLQAARWAFTGFVPAVLAVIWIVSWVNHGTDTHERYGFAHNGGVNFAMAWCQTRKARYRLATGETRWFAPPVFRNRDPLSDIVTDIPFSQQGYYFRIGLACLRQNPERLFENLRHVANIWWSRFYPDLIDSRPHRVALSFWMLATIPLALAFLAYPFVFREQGWGWLFAFFLLSSLVIAVYLTNPGEERYVVPYYFALILWGMPVIVRLVERAGGRLSPISGVLVCYGLWVSFVASLLVGAVFVSGSKQFATPSNWREAESRPTVEIKRAGVLNSYELALEWLHANQRSDGGFFYRTSTRSFERLDGDSTTRQLLTSHGLANAARYFRDPALTALHRRNLEYLKSLLVETDSYSYIRGPTSWLPVNETSFAIMTLIDSPLRDQHRVTVARLGEFLLRMQNEQGRFSMSYPPTERGALGKRQDYRRQRFASGEAAFACAKIYEFLGDDRFLNCAHKAFRHYAPYVSTLDDPAFAAWHSIAYSKLYTLQRKEEYLEVIKTLTTILMDLQNSESSTKKVPGGFDAKHVWWTSAEGVFTEALGYAYRVMRTSDPGVARRLQRANELGLYNLMRAQLRHYSTPSIRGGMQSDVGKKQIQVDDVGHSLAAFNEYLTRAEASPASDP